MAKLTKNQRLRDKARLDTKYSKQSTLDSPAESKTPSKPVLAEQQKRIEITEINATNIEDELELRVGFRLFPSKASFSRLSADLFFDGLKVDSLRLRVLQGPLATDCAEFSSVLDLSGIEAGSHLVRVEMYELWGEDERLIDASKEATIDYVPEKRQDRLVRVPIVKLSAGADLAIVSDTERKIYSEINQELKNESASRRDRW